MNPPVFGPLLGFLNLGGEGSGLGGALLLTVAAIGLTLLGLLGFGLGGGSDLGCLDLGVAASLLDQVYHLNFALGVLLEDDVLEESAVLLEDLGGGPVGDLFLGQTVADFAEKVPHIGLGLGGDLLADDVGTVGKGEFDVEFLHFQILSISGGWILYYNIWFRKVNRRDALVGVPRIPVLVVVVQPGAAVDVGGHLLHLGQDAVLLRDGRKVGRLVHVAGREELVRGLLVEGDRESASLLPEAGIGPDVLGLPIPHPAVRGEGFAVAEELGEVSHDRVSSVVVVDIII